uniref:Uncharacterized protein n=1 Tax=Wuchereria bancrofti TaxID=6293 RepID=A0AAF5PYD4_WUCBA
MEVNTVDYLINDLQVADLSEQNLGQLDELHGRLKSLITRLRDEPKLLQQLNEVEDENECLKSEVNEENERDMETSDKITTLNDGPISSRTRSHVILSVFFSRLKCLCRQIGRKY